MKAMRLVILSAFCVSSMSQAMENPFATTDAHSFTLAAPQLHARLSSPGNYDALSAADKKAIDADLTQMQRLLTRYGQTSQLKSLHAVQYFNAQEHLNGLLSGDLASRYQCQLFGEGIISCRMYSLIATSRGVSASDDGRHTSLMARQITRPVDMPHVSRP